MITTLNVRRSTPVLTETDQTDENERLFLQHRQQIEFHLS